MNDYFNAPATPVDFTTARAAAIRALFAAVAAGFDLLPERDALLQGRVNYAVAGGTGNALTATLDPAPESYVDGASLRLRLTATNTGPATLNVNGLGAISIRDNSGAELAGGELVSGAIQDVTYNGTHFRLPATGPAGPQGPVGPTDGLSVLNGTDDPAGGDGQDGDFYINTTSWDIFGPKTAGAWPAGVSLIGPQGPAGNDGDDGTDAANVLSGAAAPVGGTGIDGDYYFKTTAPITFYGPKAAGVWPAGVSLKGDTGAAGVDGDDAVVDEAADYAWTGTHTFDGNEAGYRDLPISRSVAGSFTFDADDRGEAITYTGTGGHTGTFPLNAVEAIPVGSIITVANIGSATLTIGRGTDGTTTVALKLAGTGVDANRSLAVGGVAWFWKIATNTVLCGGAGLT